jgi:hypothetical protein
VCDEHILWDLTFRTKLHLELRANSRALIFADSTQDEQVQIDFVEGFSLDVSAIFGTRLF